MENMFNYIYKGMLGNLLKGIFNSKSSIKVDLLKLPSQGLFYNDGFTITIKKADIEDIVFYDANYKEDPLNMIWLIKQIVQRNTILSKGYTFLDIASIDIVFLFFEIVRLTKGEEIWINHSTESVQFNEEHFNYFEISKEMMEKYDSVAKEFVIGGFRFKLPSIGIETSVTKFISDTAIDGTLSKYTNKSYDFMFFLGDIKELTNEEIINLLTIFNEELGDDEKETVKSIIKEFSNFNRYTLLNDNGDVVEINQLDLSLIWE